MGPKKAAGKKAPPGGENGGELDPEQKITFLMHTCQSLQVQLGRYRFSDVLYFKILNTDVRYILNFDVFCDDDDDDDDDDV